MSFVLVGFMFTYPHVRSTLNLPISHGAVVSIGFLVLAFVITPLYWKSIMKQAKKEKQNSARVKQPWE
jgi:uncharacterized membrane protein (DUF485 family)